MKILFLDVDGVLNGKKDFNIDKGSEFNPLNRGSMDLLRSLIDTTGVKIVFSSVWRLSDDEHGWKKVCKRTPLSMNDLHPFFKTPYLHEDHHARRGQEIKMWMDKHGKDVEKYAIVDDDSDMLEEQLPFFVHTSFDKGLGPREFLQLFDLLV